MGADHKGQGLDTLIEDRFNLAWGKKICACKATPLSQKQFNSLGGSCCCIVLSLTCEQIRTTMPATGTLPGSHSWT